MRSHSERFAAAVRESHGLWCEVDLYGPGGVASGDLRPELIPVSGDVTLDRSAAVRGQVQLVVAARELVDWPDLAELAYGGEVVVRRGVRYSDDEVELVGLGVYRVDSVGEAFPGEGVRISGYDRMAQVQDERFEAPRSFSGQQARDAITTVVREVYPGLPVHDTTTTSAVLTDAMYERERIEVVTDMARALAGEAYMDGAGELVLRPLPDLATAPSALDVDAGAQGIMVKAARSLEREGAYNAVVASSQPEGDYPPVLVTVRDEDPTSPTRWGGPFGKVPQFWSSPAYMSAADLRTAALGILGESLGLRHVIDLEAVPNPALEPGDVVSVYYPGFEPPFGYAERHVVDVVRIPLGPTGPMSLGTRTIYQGTT